MLTLIPLVGDFIQQELLYNRCSWHAYVCDMKINCSTLTKIAVTLTALWFWYSLKDATTNTAKRHLSTFVSYIRSNSSDVSVHTDSQFMSSSTHISSATLLPLYHNFTHALSLRADAHRYIILAITDEGFIDMAVNFYETSLRAHYIDNFLFVGIGKKICEILTRSSIPCYQYADSPNADKASDYGGREFNRKVRIRTNMMIEALEANYTIIHCDIDIVFLRNPMPSLEVNT